MTEGAIFFTSGAASLTGRAADLPPIKIRRVETRPLPRSPMDCAERERARLSIPTLPLICG